MYNTGQGTYSYSHGPVDMGKSTSNYTGNLFVGYWQAPAAALGTKWNTNDEVRPKNVAVLYCRYSGGSGVSIPAGANQVSQDNSTVTVTDSGANGTIALTTNGVGRVNIDASGNVGIGTTTPGICLGASGKLNLTHYSDTANHHRNDAFFGYCDNVAVGSHTLTVYVGNVAGWGYYVCFTGWDSQHWALEVEEVN